MADLEDFVRCPQCGGDEPGVSGCEACDRTGEVQGYLAFLLTEATFHSGKLAFRVVDDGWTQVEEGCTSSAAAAYLALRDHLKLPGTKVRPGPQPSLRRRWGPDPQWGSVLLESSDGKRLLLTGVGWGRMGGEGTKSLAAILVNLGLFDGIGQAVQWVRSQDQNNRLWCLTT